jgi:hypothetical protein
VRVVHVLDGYDKRRSPKSTSGDYEIFNNARVLVVNTTPLDDDEADYLVSRERQRSDREIPLV